MSEPPSSDPHPATLSIVMPAFEEEAGVARAMRIASAAASRCFADHELLVVDDGSRDATAARVRAYAAENPHVRLLEHDTNRGFGASYDTGRFAAQMDYTVMVQGDGPFSEETLVAFFRRVGEADVICGYWNNPQERSAFRRVVSRLYTAILNGLFGYRMRYYNGLQLYRTAWLRELPLTSRGFGFQAETLLAALREGMRVVQVPTDYIERPDGGVTKAFRLKNVTSVLGTIWQLVQIERAARRARPA